MRLLLDTHVWLWVTTGSARIPQHVRDAVGDRRNVVVFSAVSALEIAVKYRLGKLPLPLAPAEYIATMIGTSGLATLPISVEHAAAVASLPDHHRDPFDRLLIAQAVLEHLTLVTADRIMRAYAVPRLEI